MTLDEFVEAFAAKVKAEGLKFELRTEAIRECETGRCPIEVVAGVERGDWRSGAHDLGLSQPGVRDQIMSAADFYKAPLGVRCSRPDCETCNAREIETRLRPKLLAAAGVEETSR